MEERLAQNSLTPSLAPNLCLATICHRSKSSVEFTQNPSIMDAPVTFECVRQFLMSDYVRVIVSKDRHGFKFYDDNFRAQVHRKRPTYSNLYLSGDGVTFDAYYMTEKGVRTMLQAWIWVDWFSEAIVGYDIGYEENGEMVRKATRNVLKLNGGIAPMEFQQDNSTAAKAKSSQ